MTSSEHTNTSIRWVKKAFNELTVVELYQVLKLRQDVFIIEQNCPYDDIDGIDPHCIHVLGIIGHDLVAYGRIVPSGARFENPSIGRIAVMQSMRRLGLGKKLMAVLIEETKLQFDEMEITISAQEYLESFYQDFGFIKQGPGYLEDGIPHIDMIRKNE